MHDKNEIDGGLFVFEPAASTLKHSQVIAPLNFTVYIIPVGATIPNSPYPALKAWLWERSD
jgi:hypothetical protein